MTTPEPTVEEVLETKFPEPVAIIMGRVGTELARETDHYLLKAFQEVGINPSILIQQTALIHELKSELAKKEAVIQAVLAIPRQTSGYFVEDDAYNQALSKVREAIEGELK